MIPAMSRLQRFASKAMQTPHMKEKKTPNQNNNKNKLLANCNAFTKPHYKQLC